ncbi:MAG: glycosyltransferase family 2 protein, partial [Thermotogota bacterium]|nr:glycosyltransferase family 2 protein [Thermotogota bacterium]
MSENIKVSVIIPVYNAEKYLRECLDSVVNQTLKEIEIICVDDGSTDGSLDILQEYSRIDQRFIVLTQENQYSGVARNYGLSVAKGETVHFLDADDWLEPTTYEETFETWNTTKSDFVVFFHKWYDNVTGEEGERSHRFKVGQKCSVTNFQENPDYFLYNAVVAWNKLYSREYLNRNNIRFDNLICSNDRAFYIQNLIYSKKIAIYDSFLLHYRTNNIDSLVGTKRLKNFECHFKSFENIWGFVKEQPLEIKKKLIDITLRDFFGFYKKATGEDLVQIEKLLTNYLPTMPIEILGDNLSNFPWFKSYMSIMENV